MNVQLRAVSATGDASAYQILLEVGSQPYVFVVRIERDPVVNVQAPHSFWVLCESNRIEAGSLLKVVERVAAGEEIEFPVAEKGGGGTVPRREQRVVGGKIGCAYFEGSSASSHIILRNTRGHIFVP